MDESAYIPRRLNDPWKLWWFDAEAVFAFSVVFMLGIVADHMKIAAALGACLAFGVQKLKSDRHPGYTAHLIHWYLPPPLTPLRRLPPSHMREMIG